jgi:hypothetical protein
MQSFEITIDENGNVETSLKGFEGRSPELAAIVETAVGGVQKVDWNPKAHAHVHNGKKVYHSH